MALQRVREAAEKAKIELSTTIQTEINLPFITQAGGEPRHILMELSRAKLENLCESLIRVFDLNLVTEHSLHTCMGIEYHVM